MSWEQRYHPLRDEWVVVAGHRQNRPWSGEEVGDGREATPDYVPDCYLCPGNRRVSGAKNATYEDVFVFDNDHPCVGPDAPPPTPPVGIYRSKQASGLARVVCYSPKHNVTLAELSTVDIERLLVTWQEQCKELSMRPEVSQVLVFENKGEVVGVSNPHPHCQIYATNFVFKTFEIEAIAAEKHFHETGRVLFQDVIEAEKIDGRRVLFENEGAIAFIPYFARYAYETYVAPKRSHPGIGDLDAGEIAHLAQALKDVLVRFDNLWKMPFPYVMALHQAPTDEKDYSSFHFHIQFHPPLRKPNLLKYLAGPEIGGGNFISDTCPEDKAHELRSVSSVHYKQALREKNS